MRHLRLLFIMMLCVGTMHAQTMEELKTMQADKNAQIAELQSQIDAISGEVGTLQKEIDILSGWRKGINGTLGFDLNNSNGWIANPNPDATSSSLAIGLTAFANNDKRKTFWHNKAVVQKAWQDVDKSDADSALPNDGLFDNGTVDLLNVSSLGGYKITEKLALSGLGELNTSLGNFLEPGTIDIGIGATYLPNSHFTIVVHPLNLHGQWWSAPSKDAFNSVNMDFDNPAFYLGAKLRVDYTNSFSVLGKKIGVSSTLTGFVPYSSEKIQSPAFTDGVFNGGFDESGPTEYTWLTQLSFEVWRGIGVGIGWGLRNNEFESSDLQSFTSLGLAYGF